MDHIAEVMNSWLYLTGKLDTLKNEVKKILFKITYIFILQSYQNDLASSKILAMNHNKYSMTNSNQGNVHQYNNYGNQFQQTGVSVKNNTGNSYGKNEGIVKNI